MSSNFKLYSAYYDLLYQDKDYKSEAAYVNRQLRQLIPAAGEIQLLELGSGTGNHARYLSAHGYNITGVERSPEMIELAKRKSISNFHPELSDITTFKFDRQFDVAVSLFHSMCYLVTNDQLLAAFSNVSKHLKPGGFFAFDFWYGPAVLNDIPTARTKFQQNDLMEVSRSGYTTMFVNENVAEVNYEVVIKDKASGRSESFKEKHPMRYFSVPEIALIAGQCGFKLVGFEEYLTGNEPTLESWNIFVKLQKVG